MTTSQIQFTQKYAPGLVHLVEQLEPHDSVICSFSAGPQPCGGGAWGDVPHIVIQPESLYGNDPDFVVIYGETNCTIHSQCGEEYSITFQGLLDYLAQLPRPLWSFAE